MFTTNLTATLDYSVATNPVIRLTYPQDGMEICGNTFTLRGWTDDAGATVAAQIADAGGDTNLVTGLVERTGVLWAENLPLAEGTNWITVWVTNAAGLGSETNLAVVKSDMTFALTNIDGDLWLPTVTVHGVISDPAAPVWVNGVQGTNYGNGTWSAANVPVSAGGMASFDFSTLPPGAPDPNGTTNVAKPDELKPASATWHFHEVDNLDGGVGGAIEDFVNEGSFSIQSGGHAHDEVKIMNTDGTVYYSWMYDDTLDSAQNISVERYVDSLGNVTTTTNDGLYNIAEERGSYDEPPSWQSSKYHQDREVKMTYYLGGQVKAGSQVLIAGTASATETYPGSTNIPYNQITDGELGQLGDDGWVYAVKPEGSAPDVTPQASAPYYQFGTGPGAYRPHIFANGIDLSTNTPEFCVGQSVILGADWQGGIWPPYVSADIRWHLPDKYVNEQYQYSSTCPSYRQNADALTNSPIQCWYVNKPGGACSVREILHFNNGKYATVVAAGNFTIYRPQKLAENMAQDFLNRSVNIPTPTLYATNVNGLLELGDSQGGYARFWAEYQTSYSGEFQEAQIVQAYLKAGNDDPVDSGSQWWGDGAGNKAGSYSTVSSAPGVAFVMQTDRYPGVPLIPPQSVINEVFKTYFQFKPAGDGIWVTIGRVNWAWAATSAYSSGQWNPPSGTSVSDPQYHDDDSFPLWDDVTTNHLNSLSSGLDEIRRL